MTSDDRPMEPTPPRRAGLNRFLLIALLAFAAGIAATAIIIQQYGRWFPTAAKSMFVDVTPPSTADRGFVPPPEAGATSPLLDAETLGAREAALAAQIANLEARAAAIDQESRAAAGNAGRAEGLLIAFAARRAIDRGLGLGFIETQLRQRFGTTQPRAVAIVVRAARDPVTIEDLRLGLDSIAPQLTTNVASEGWWASLRREMAGLIVIRKEGTPSPRPADRIARIRRLLDAQQVEAALAEAARLPGAEQGGRWMAAAARYVDAHHALDVIETAAILSQGTVAPAAPPITPPAAPPAPAGGPTT